MGKMTKRWDILQTQMWVFMEETKAHMTTSLDGKKHKVCCCKRSTEVVWM